MKIPSLSALDSNPRASHQPSVESANRLLSPEQLQPSGVSEIDESQPLKLPPIQEAFQDFVGQTFFGQMIASMRSTQNETPYFNGGRAEKIFQGQLDQVLAEEISDASASQFADPMFQLFQLQRR